MSKNGDTVDAERNGEDQFCAIHGFYGTVVFVVSLTAFGLDGLIPAVVLGIVWGGIFLCQSRPRGLAICLVLLVPACGFLLLPSLSHPRPVWDRINCNSNLRSLTHALHNYHDTYHSFPPAFVADQDGRPMHSWRVLILPFIECQTLYDRYDFEEPWDGPNNVQLLDEMPRSYCCPLQFSPASAARGQTSYFAIVGERTAWPRDEAMILESIADGSSNTLLICEALDRRIPWTQPTDLDMVETMELLTFEESAGRSVHVHQSFLYEWFAGRHIGLADGSTRFLQVGLLDEDARRLIMRDDGQSLDSNVVNTEIRKPRLRSGNCFRVAVFALIALWPLPWVWIHPHGTAAE